MGEFAVIGVELVNRLLRKGFELVEVKEGKYTTVYYFTETTELVEEVESYLKDNDF
jgi:hypothetical protein